MGYKKTLPRMLRVAETYRIGANLKRVVLTGDSLCELPEDIAPAHVKLFIPRHGQEKPILPVITKEGKAHWEKPDEKPIIRTYSISHFEKETKQLSIDIVLHRKGPVSDWAFLAKVGDWAAIAGPGKVREYVKAGEYYLFAGDLSALPAIKALIRKLPADSQGKAVIEVPSREDVADIHSPNSDFEIEWLINKKNEAGLLTKHFQDLSFPKLLISPWVAGESSDVVGLRALLKSKGIQVRGCYIIPYWKRGANEEEYHAERHAIMDEEE